MDKETSIAGREGKQLVKLSQCMIVKNEEKNIEKALGWARDIAFEQIVVDTGSTDRTVEIAEKMGAKVYHFEWINDFSAAKNYAIEQATGNWIAFLDADEYFLPDDTAELMNILTALEASPDMEIVQLLNCSWVHLDEKNKPFSIGTQQRIFRNRPEIRYVRRIHEQLTVSKKSFDASNLKIMHTGYSANAFEDTGKVGRNISMLREEIERNPEDTSNWVYLADVLKISGREEDLAEMETLCRRVLDTDLPVGIPVRERAYYLLVCRFVNDENNQDEAMRFCGEAVEHFPENLDYLYFYAAVKNRKNEYSDAWNLLKKSESIIANSTWIKSRLIGNYAKLLYQELALTAQGLGDMQNLIKYITMCLKEDLYDTQILMPYIAALKSGDISNADIIGLLQKLYDFSNVRDKMFLIRAAKDCGAISLAQSIMDMITPQERQWMSGRRSENEKPDQDERR